MAQIKTQVITVNNLLDLNNEVSNKHINEQTQENKYCMQLLQIHTSLLPTITGFSYGPHKYTQIIRIQVLAHTGALIRPTGNQGFPENSDTPAKPNLKINARRNFKMLLVSLLPEKSS